MVLTIFALWHVPAKIRPLMETSPVKGDFLSISIVDHKDKRLCSVPNFLFAIHSIYVIIMRNYGFNIDHLYHINNPLPDLLHLSSNCQYESTNNMQNFKDPNEHALNNYQHSTTRMHRLLPQLLLSLAIGASLSPLPFYNMSNVAKLEFPALEVNGKNYMPWTIDAEMHLSFENTLINC
ncbi:hypothetical protein LXL04_023211 [Taraxacum kok-saghyz]